jgi:hypothetical protein
MKHFVSLGIVFLYFVFGANAQVLSGNTNTNGSKSNAIFTAAPFLNIAPDARSGAMGDAGVALSPSVYDTHWNPSKLAFLAEESYVSLSYSPWLRRIAPDANLGYLNFAKKLNDRSAIGLSFNYFNLGNVNIYDPNEVYLGSFKPNEWSVDVALARKFGEGFSMGFSLRYIHSAIVPSGGTNKPANAIAADISMYYSKKISQFGKDGELSFGANLSNIGTKMSYEIEGQRYFLPANFRIGIANAILLDPLSKLTFTLDLNKLMVPTPPLRDANGNINAGRDDNRTITAGILGSFSDAPGGFKEELKEISFSPGIEYLYNNQLAMRMGYFYENPDKGDRRYLTLGAGYLYKDLQLDFSYLVANESISPLSNTIRITLGYKFGSLVH